MSIQIETGIPLPYLRGAWEKILDGLAINDCFVVPEQKDRQRILQMAKRKGYKVTSEKLDGGGYRLWLLEKPK